MNYHQSSKQELVDFVSEIIKSKLQSNQKVLWLLSGGSGGQICIEIAKTLENQNLDNLFITMGDERYVKPGSEDENFYNLENRGLGLNGAHKYRLLDGTPIEETTKNFDNWLRQTISKVDFTISITGMGTDGHVFGIKPKSIATTSTSNVAHFEAEDFKRITITHEFVKNYINHAVLQVYGDEKHEKIANLLNKNGNVSDFPGLIFWSASQVDIFSDYKKEK